MHLQVMRFGKQVFIAIVGGAVVLAGVAMLVLPGPGILTVALGLAVLALEFERPRVWLARLKARGVDLKHRFDQRRSRSRDVS
ncbi:MAG TPA: PGPGW domain-containing protein [Steroidobacteraceae bacterium]|nr:PGPGW domain-containing protein [Steroidobacteraceae bacterium]